MSAISGSTSLQSLFANLQQATASSATSQTSSTTGAALSTTPTVQGHHRRHGGGGGLRSQIESAVEERSPMRRREATSIRRYKPRLKMCSSRARRPRPVRPVLMAQHRREPPAPPATPHSNRSWRHMASTCSSSPPTCRRPFRRPMPRAGRRYFQHLLAAPSRNRNRRECLRGLKKG